MDYYSRVHSFDSLMSQAFSKSDVEALRFVLTQESFFSSPASTKYHGNYPGGLYDHSYMVTISLLNLTHRLGLAWSRKQSPYIVGMLHDMCKCDSYIRKADGTYDYNTHTLLNGHGEKSVIMIQKFLTLTDEEIACIRWHMGAFDDKENWNRYGEAIEKYPNVLYTHTADMIASRIKGV